MSTQSTNKVAIVTGGAQGIGKSIALHLSRKGFRLAILDLSDIVFETAKEISGKTGREVLPVKCDVSNFSEVDRAMNEVYHSLGQIDVLVNNAGIFPSKRFMEMTESDWDRVLNTNLKSNFNCSKIAAAKMIEQKKGGRIVSISSIAGAFVGMSELAHYCASKAGIVGFVRALAIELAPYGITVNAVAPGVIETPAGLAETTPEGYEQFRKSVPMGRWGSTGDVASIVSFLVSDESSYITGQCIVVDGGYATN